MEEKYGKGDDTAVLQRKLEWLESTDAQNRYYHQQDTEDDEKDPISNYGTVDEREENLYLYVLSQLEVMDLEPELLPVGRFLVESLNQNGWLDESVEDLAEELGKPVEEVEKALAAVQSLSLIHILWCSGRCLPSWRGRTAGSGRSPWRRGPSIFSPPSWDCWGGPGWAPWPCPSQLPPPWRFTACRPGWAGRASMPPPQGCRRCGYSG